MQHVLRMATWWLLLGSALLATSASPPLPLHLLGDLLAARAELHAGGNAALAASYGLVMEQAEKKGFVFRPLPVGPQSESSISTKLSFMPTSCCTLSLQSPFSAL